MNKKIRTRFAPSPTGKMHVGNLRTALYAYLIAKHENGDFLIRIEDTDQERFVDGAIETINRTMEKAGLIHDEGPDKDGGFGPYVQSERQTKGIYLKHAKELISKGQAYYCFCNKERLETLKTDSFGLKYDKHCLNLSQEEVDTNLAKGMDFVIRQNNPIEGRTTFVDEIYGEISVDNSELDDMILMKSDGYPTYNFANVVDDHLMEITHVVRGNEYLSSSPKYNRLYEAFEWDVPVYVHCPLITDENNNKLSKRSGHASYEDLLTLGYLDEVIVNYVALLGWSPEGNEEMFSLAELIKTFDYKRINKSPAVFDMKKFTWMNSEYLKNMDVDVFYDMALPYIKEVIFNESINLKKVAALVQSRCDVIKDIPKLIDFLEIVPEYNIELHNHKRMKTNPQVALTNLKLILPILESIENFKLDVIHEKVISFVAELGIKNGQVLWPLRTALSGKASTPGGAFDIADLLGQEESIKRIKSAISKLETDINV